MSARFLCLRLLGCRLLAACLCLISQCVEADEYPPYATVGTQMVGMTVGPMIPIRLLTTQSSKLFGEVVIPSWSMTLTEPVGSGWYQGQLALGAELPTFRTDEPVTAYGVGIAPKLVYTVITFGCAPMWKVVAAPSGPISEDVCRRSQGSSISWSGVEPDVHTLSRPNGR